MCGWTEAMRPSSGRNREYLLLTAIISRVSGWITDSGRFWQQSFTLTRQGILRSFWKKFHILKTARWKEAQPLMRSGTVHMERSRKRRTMLFITEVCWNTFYCRISVHFMKSEIITSSDFVVQTGTMHLIWQRRKAKVWPSPVHMPEICGSLQITWKHWKNSVAAQKLKF